MREIERGCTNTYPPFAVDPASTQAADLRAWLAAQAAAHGLRWLLAHAEDGVIWGELRDDGALHLSCEAFGPATLALRWDTIQQARLFGADGELLLWPGPDGWQARLISDGAGAEAEWIDEQHLLWGDHQADGSTTIDGFMQTAEGSQGIVHAPPIDTTPSDRHRVGLLVRHYLREDTAGVARIAYSRLVRLLRPGEYYEY